MKTANLTTARYGYLADRLGQLRADVKSLQDQAKEIEDQLKQELVEHAEGQLFQVKISYGIETNRTDWKGIAAKLKPSRQLITANTKQTISDRVTVTAYRK